MRKTIEAILLAIQEHVIGLLTSALFSLVLGIGFGLLAAVLKDLWTNASSIQDVQSQLDSWVSAIQGIGSILDVYGLVGTITGIITIAVKEIKKFFSNNRWR